MLPCLDAPTRSRRSGTRTEDPRRYRGTRLKFFRGHSSSGTSWALPKGASTGGLTGIDAPKCIGGSSGSAAGRHVDGNAGHVASNDSTFAGVHTGWNLEAQSAYRLTDGP